MNSSAYERPEHAYIDKLLNDIKNDVTLSQDAVVVKNLVSIINSMVVAGKEFPNSNLVLSRHNTEYGYLFHGYWYANIVYLIGRILEDNFGYLAPLKNDRLSYEWQWQHTPEECAAELAAVRFDE